VRQVIQRIAGTYGAARQAGTRIAAQAGRYVRSLGWLLGESYAAEPGIWWRVLLATVLSLVANAVAIAIIYRYVQAIEHDLVIELAGIGVGARESIGLLRGVVLALLLALLVHAASLYIARSSAVRLARLFEQWASMRVLDVSRFLPDPRARQAHQILCSTKLLHVISMDPRNAGMALRFLVNLLPSGLTLAFALPVLFYLDTSTTLIVCGIGVLVISLQYPSNLFAAKATVVWHRTRPIVQREILDLLARLHGEPAYAASEEVRSQVETYYNAVSAKEHMDAYENRLLAMELSALSMQLGGAIVLATLVLLVGRELLVSGADWARLIAYVGVLRLVIANLTNLFKTLTGVSRFYPQIQRLRDFIISAQQAKRPLVPAERAPCEPLVLRVATSAGDPHLVRLERGKLYALLTSEGYGRELAMRLHSALEGGFDDVGVRGKSVDQLVPALSQHPAAEPNRKRVVEAFDSAVANPPDLLLIDRRALEVIAEAEWHQRQIQLAESVLILVYPDAGKPVADLGELCLLHPGAGDRFVVRDLKPGGMSAGEAQRLRRSLRSGGQSKPDDQGDLDVGG